MSQINGVVIGLVTNVNDPEGIGRIQVRLPSLDNQPTYWARMATMMAGNRRGFFFVPDVDDEVLVAFEHGDVHTPYVIGFLWNGEDAPPASGTKDALVMKDAHGNTILMSHGQITIKATAQLRLMAPTVVINGRVVSPNPNPI